jgi:hypothetical protein
VFPKKLPFEGSVKALQTPRDKNGEERSRMADRDGKASYFM